MKKQIRESWVRFKESRIKRELQRLLPLLALAGLVLIPDSSFPVLLFVMGAVIFAAAVSHALRKILFPYVDLERVIEGACLTPLGAAITLASIVYLMGKFLDFASVLLK